MTQDEKKTCENMELQDIRKLIDMLSKSTLDELELELGETRLRLSRHHPPEAAPVAAPAPAPVQVAIPAPAPAPAAPAAQAPAAEAPAAPAENAAPAELPANVTVVTSPMVGTFYRSASPGGDPFVKVGDRVKVGQVLCIVEAMKLMNEIEAEMDGVIVDILVENAQPIEYGEALFHVEAGG